MLIDADIDALLKTASLRADVDWLCVMAIGTVFAAQDRIVKMIEDAIAQIQEPVLVLGQLINKKGRYCGLHEQMFIVNLSMYRELGCPKFGGYEGGTKVLANYTAGESIHDDYTPKSLIPTPGTVETQTWTCGWSFVSASMNAGLKIHNLPENLRNEKLYAYPDDNRERLNHNLEMLYQLEDMPNPQQRRLIGFLLNKRLGFNPVFQGTGVNLTERDQTVFLLNTEVLLVDRGWTKQNRQPLDAYIGPCAGFLDLASLHAYGSKPETKVIYFDINARAIEVRKRMLEEFDGDLDRLLPYLNELRTNYGPEKPFHLGNVDKAMAQIFKVFGDKETFQKAWRNLQAKPKEFHQLNLISENRKLLEQVGADSSAVFAISDIFTGQNELTYGHARIIQHYRSFVEQSARHPGLILTGKDVWGTTFVNFADQIEI